MRAFFKYLTSLLFVAVVVQVGVAAVGVFKAFDLADANGSVTKDQLENGFDLHRIFGTIVGVLILVIFIAAFSLGMESRVRMISAGLLALTALQFFFAWLGTKSAWAGFLHGITALALYAAVAFFAHRAWARRPAEVSSPPPEPAQP